MTLRRLAVFALICVPVILFSSCKRKTSSSSPAPTSNSDSNSDSGSDAWSISFSTVDSAIPSTPSSGSIFGSVAPDGALYVTGMSGTSMIIRKSADKGASWATASDYGSSSQGLGIDVDSAGRIFAVGIRYLSPYHGLIRRSTDNGATWTDVFDGEIYSGQSTYFTGVTHDSADRLYVVGVSRKDGIYHHVTMKSEDHGDTWTQIDDYAPDGFRYGTPNGILVASSGKIYVWINQIQDGDGAEIRMSADNGATWRTIYQAFGRHIGGLVEWSDGLVMSETITNVSVSTWQVVGTTDDFSHVEIIEGVNPTGSTGTYAGDLKVDSRGYLYAIGYYTDADYNAKVILVGTRGDGNFITLDTFPSDEYISAFDSAIFFDKEKGIYYGATASQSTTTDWIIRKGTVTSTTTFTPQAIASGSDLQNVIPTGAKRMFLSATTHTGVMGVSEAGAIAAADASCNADANKPVGSSTYKALLVNASRVACTTPFCSGGTSEHTDWVLSPTTQYVRTNGTSIGTTDANGLFTAFDDVISLYNTNQPWIGLSFYLDWTIQTDDPDNANFYCTGWTSSAGYGGSWSPNDTDFPVWVYAAWANPCTDERPLLCVEQ